MTVGASCPVCTHHGIALSLDVTNLILAQHGLFLHDLHGQDLARVHLAHDANLRRGRATVTSPRHCQAGTKRLPRQDAGTAGATTHLSEGTATDDDKRLKVKSAVDTEAT